MKKVIIISGATAVGKSDFALKVAEQLDGEIINADIGSMYAPLTIGTAKPNWQSEKIRHHMFDILDKPQNFTVVQFRNRLMILMEEIWNRGRLPIIVGGSAFYIKAFFYKQHEIVDTSAWIAKIEQEVEMGALDSITLWQELQNIDPVRAGQIHAHDTYRIIRALSIFKTTGKKPCEFAQIFEPLSPFFFITCKRDRQELYGKINLRVHEMMQHGWLEEVQQLKNTEWEKFLLIKKIIGYDDLLKYLHQGRQGNLTEITGFIQQKTRNYAKRQIIFLNKLQKDVLRELKRGQFAGLVQDVDLTYCNVGLYIKGLSNLILQTLS